MLGESNVRLSNLGNVCDRYWKISYTKERTIDITIHIYNKPLNKKSSKLMIQGSIQSMICSYVFNELPKVYKIVCEMAPKPLEQPVTKKLKPQVKPLVKCDQCQFKSSMIKMKMHIKRIHTNKSQKAPKRSPIFTPIANPSK